MGYMKQVLFQTELSSQLFFPSVVHGIGESKAKLGRGGFLVDETMERETGLEPATSTLARLRSTN